MIALAALPVLALALFALGSVMAARNTSQAHTSFIQGWLHALSTGFGLFPAATQFLTQQLANWMGKAYAPVDASVGASFHHAATLVRKIGAAIAVSTYAIIALAHYVRTAPSWANVHKLNAALYRAIVAVEHAAESANAHTRSFARGAAASAVAGVLPRLGRLEHQADTVLPKEIATTRDLAKGAERVAERAWHLVRTRPWQLATAGIASVVAIGLGAFGLGGLRCNSLVNSLRNRGCGFWQGLEDLLGLLVDVAFVASICDVIPALETAFSIVAAPLIGQLAGIGAGLCKGSAGPPETLPPPGLALPPNPTLTLSLP